MYTLTAPERRLIVARFINHSNSPEISCSKFIRNKLVVLSAHTQIKMGSKQNKHDKKENKYDRRYAIGDMQKSRRYAEIKGKCKRKSERNQRQTETEKGEKDCTCSIFFIIATIVLVFVVLFSWGYSIRSDTIFFKAPERQMDKKVKKVVYEIVD